MGRQKKSETEKRQEGRKRNLQDDPVISPIKSCRAPSEMPVEQKKFWKLYAPYLVSNSILTNLNYSDLERLCYYEAQLARIHQLITQGNAALLQEKKNYHGDVVDLVESTYSKLSRNYMAVVRIIKGDLKIRTDKLTFKFPPKKESKFKGLVNVKE